MKPNDLSGTGIPKNFNFSVPPPTFTHKGWKWPNGISGNISSAKPNLLERPSSFNTTPHLNSSSPSQRNDLPLPQSRNYSAMPQRNDSRPSQNRNFQALPQQNISQNQKSTTLSQRDTSSTSQRRNNPAWSQQTNSTSLQNRNFLQNSPQSNQKNLPLPQRNITSMIPQNYSAVSQMIDSSLPRQSNSTLVQNRNFPVSPQNSLQSNPNNPPLPQKNASSTKPQDYATMSQRNDSSLPRQKNSSLVQNGSFLVPPQILPQSNPNNLPLPTRNASSLKPQDYSTVSHRNDSSVSRQNNSTLVQNRSFSVPPQNLPQSNPNNPPLPQRNTPTTKLQDYSTMSQTNNLSLSQQNDSALVQNRSFPVPPHISPQSNLNKPLLPQRNNSLMKPQNYSASQRNDASLPRQTNSALVQNRSFPVPPQNSLQSNPNNPPLPQRNTSSMKPQDYSALSQQNISSSVQNKSFPVPPQNSLQSNRNNPPLPQRNTSLMNPQDYSAVTQRSDSVLSQQNISTSVQNRSFPVPPQNAPQSSQNNPPLPQKNTSSMNTDDRSAVAQRSYSATVNNAQNKANDVLAKNERVSSMERNSSPVTSTGNFNVPMAYITPPPPPPPPTAAAVPYSPYTANQGQPGTMQGYYMPSAQPYTNGYPPDSTGRLPYPYPQLPVPYVNPGSYYPRPPPPPMSRNPPPLADNSYMNNPPPSYSRNVGYYNWRQDDNRQNYYKRRHDSESDCQRKSPKKRKKPLSQTAQKKEWSVEDAVRVIETEKEYNKRNRSQSLIIKFPDAELNRDIVTKFHPTIDSVHFQQPSTPRFCFVTLKDDTKAGEVIEQLNKTPFAQGFLTAEFKKDREDEMNIKPEDIDPLTLYVGNLAQDVVKEDLVKIYPRHKRIDIGFAKKMKYTRYAFVSFKNVADAIVAFKKTHATQLYSKSLIVRFLRMHGTVGMPGRPKPQEPKKVDNDGDASESVHEDAVDGRHLEDDEDDSPRELAPWDLVDVSAWSSHRSSVKLESADYYSEEEGIMDDKTDDEEVEEKKPVVPLVPMPFAPMELELAFSAHKPKIVEIKKEEKQEVDKEDVAETCITIDNDSMDVQQPPVDTLSSSTSLPSTAEAEETDVKSPSGEICKAEVKSETSGINTFSELRLLNVLYAQNRHVEKSLEVKEETKPLEVKEEAKPLDVKEEARSLEVKEEARSLEVKKEAIDNETENGTSIGEDGGEVVEVKDEPANAAISDDNGDGYSSEEEFSFGSVLERLTQDKSISGSL